MKPTTRSTPILIAVGLLLAAPPLTAAGLEEARIYIEYNSTDQDVGIQVFLDAEEWRVMKIFDPKGHKIFHIEGLGPMADIGLSELFFEGNEPSVEDLPLEEFFARFPEGVYRIEGKTPDGEVLRAHVRFSHAIPDGPVIVSPGEGEAVDPNDAEICWEPVTTPAGVVIDKYEVIVADVDAFVPGSAHCFVIPPDQLQPGHEYGYEVLAVAANHNQTITAGSFETE
jgi:hypothetical protein